jgi:hypothetical protein
MDLAAGDPALEAVPVDALEAGIVEDARPPSRR